MQVTTQALVELLDHGIELAILSQSGQLRGQLTPPKAKQRAAAHASSTSWRSDEAFCLALAREMVRAKIASSRGRARSASAPIIRKP